MSRYHQRVLGHLWIRPAQDPKMCPVRHGGWGLGCKRYVRPGGRIDRERDTQDGVR